MLNVLLWMNAWTKTEGYLWDNFFRKLLSNFMYLLSSTRMQNVLLTKYQAWQRFARIVSDSSIVLECLTLT